VKSHFINTLRKPLYYNRLMRFDSLW